MSGEMQELEPQEKPPYDQGFDDGYQAGYDAGYDAGFDAGFQRGHREAFAEAFDAGYDSSYNAGHHRGFREGYLKGASDAGIAAAEEAVTALLPAHHILPQYSALELIERGLKACEAEAVRLLTGGEVADRLERALEAGQGCSVVRLGDGEAYVLAQEVVLNASEIQKKAPWIERAGVRLPDIQARDVLKEAVSKADIVGVPTPRIESHQPLLIKALEGLGVQWRRLTLTHAIINYMLQKEGRLKAILAGRRVLVAGNPAERFAQLLKRSGVEVAGAVAPVKGMSQVDAAMERVREFEFDIALISAGAAAVPLAQRIAAEMGKVAIDFGHMADELVQGHAQW